MKVRREIRKPPEVLSQEVLTEYEYIVLEDDHSSKESDNFEYRWRYYDSDNYLFELYSPVSGQAFTVENASAETNISDYITGINRAYSFWRTPFEVLNLPHLYRRLGILAHIYLSI